MNVLIDTNVLLDIMLEREPFVGPAEQVFEAAKHAPIDLFMSATTVTDLYYIARKEKGHEQTLVLIEDLLQCVEVVSVSKAVILHALHSGLPDFEDAVQEGTAKQANISIIVTRNGADFKKSDLDVYPPQEFVARYGQKHDG
jgi:predicted nucleic acid-binding protein